MRYTELPEDMRFSGRTGRELTPEEQEALLRKLNEEAGE